MMRKLTLFIFLLIAILSCESQRCDGDKQKKLQIIFSKEKWYENLKQLVQQEVIKSNNYSGAELDELYKAMIDSACLHFSNQEIDIIIKLNASNGKISNDLNNKLVKFREIAGKTGAKWAVTKFIKEKGYEYNEGIAAYYKLYFALSAKFFEKKIYENKEYNYLNFLFYGKALMALEKPNKAIEAFKKAIEINPKKAEANYELSNSYIFGMGDTKLAHTEIMKALKLEPKNNLYRLLLGDIYCGSSDFESGIKVFDSLLIIEPNNVSFLNSRALAYSFSGNAPKALIEYKRVLQIDSINKEALLNLGNLFMKQKDYDSSMFYIQKAIKNYPNNNVGYSSLACVYLMSKDYRNAVKYYSKSIELKRDYKDITSRGFAYIELGEYEKAKDDFRLVIDSAESSFSNKLGIAFSYNNLGYVEFKLGNNSIALKHVEKSLLLAPENSYAYRNKALILLSMNQKMKACEALHKSKSLKFSDFYGDEVDNLIKENCK